MTKPSISIFVPYIHAFGGVERLLVGLSRFLHEHSLSHTIVCFDQTIDLANYATWPIDVHELKPNRSPIKEALALRRYLRLAASQGAPPALLFDLKGAFNAALSPVGAYYLHLTDPPSLLPSDVSKYALSMGNRRRSDRRISLGRAIHAEIVHRINRRGVRGSAAVIVMTDTIANEIRQAYNVAPVVVRPGVSEVGLVQSSTRAFSRPLRILSVSRLEANKRIDWVLRSIAKLSPARDTVVLDIAGSGTQADPLKALAQELGLDDHVTFHGRVSDDRLRELYSAASLFVMPAVQGYGLPALEALQAGIPTILHRESGVAEILGGNPYACIIDSTEDSLTLALKTMVARIESNSFFGRLPPEVPSESEWAANICKCCQWL